MKTPEQSADERRKYVDAFNFTMVRIWLERIALLQVVDTGNLYRSVVTVAKSHDPEVTEAFFEFQFSTYGIYQNYGTGRDTPRGNGGDLGRAKRRVPRKWFSVKYFASTMNIKEFFADNLGRHFCGIFANALDEKGFRASLVKKS